MPSFARRRALVLFLFSFVLVCAGTAARAGMTHYTEPGQTDFDTALQTINPYGAWSKIDGEWAYTPFDHQAPYTNGRWIYTEYGWFWKGNHPHSWVTEHYGYWKRGADKVWSWYPGPYWLPQIVEIRSTSTYIGWRSAAVDGNGNFIEKPEDRWAKTDEWTFVTLAQFANPITPGIVASPDVAAAQLEDSVDSTHTYVTYRPIDRPGPHPADFMKLCKDGGMFAPFTLQDQLALQQAPPLPLIPGVTPGTTLVDTNVNVAPPMPNGLANPSAVPSGLAGQKPAVVAPVAKADPSDPSRKVKYWITKCLPTYWTPPPPEAKPGEIYIYRPDFFQDEDGIARRVAIWLDPSLLRKTKQSLASLLSSGSRDVPASTNTTASAVSATPAIPAVPASPEPAKPYNPFASSLADPYHGGAPRPPSASTKSGTNTVADPNAPVPPPVSSNAAPASPQ